MHFCQMCGNEEARFFEITCVYIVTFTHNLTNSLRYKVSTPVPRDFSQFLLISVNSPLLVFQIP